MSLLIVLQHQFSEQASTSIETILQHLLLAHVLASQGW